MKRLLMVVVLLFLASNVFAATFNGKIDIVQTTSSGTRFYVQSQALSLFTTSIEHRELLTQAFFRKAIVTVSYTQFTCTGGITGTCGNITLVSVLAGNIP